MTLCAESEGRGSSPTWVFFGKIFAPKSEYCSKCQDCHGVFFILLHQHEAAIKVFHFLLFTLITYIIKPTVL